MSVCATCYQHGLPADSWHDCSGLGEIQVTRERGHGLRVDTAPARVRMALNVLADSGWGATMQGADCINIADQALYQVVAYDPIKAALVLELVEDWRPKSADTTQAEPAVAGQPLTATQAAAVRAADLTGGSRITREVVDEAVRQMDADPHGLHTGMVVKPYTERGVQKWVSRCWGTSTCAGWLSLDHASENSAGSARDRHLVEAHPELVATALRERRERAGLLCAALREVLAAFATVTSPTSGAPMGYQAPPIHPDDMDRWRAALDQPAPAAPLTDADGRTICTCTYATPCGCGTSVHYTDRKEPTP